MTTTLLVKTARVELFPLLFGHPGPFAVRAVLSQEPLLGRGATEGTGREAPAALHENLPMDPLHQVVDEDRSPQVHLGVIDEPELLQGHVKDVRSLLKNGDGLKIRDRRRLRKWSIACSEAGPCAVDARPHLFLTLWGVKEGPVTR